MQVLSNLGESPSAIARQMEVSHHTVIKYLDSKAFDDPIVTDLVDRIMRAELNDLALIGVKCRQRLHELLDANKTTAIETTAIMDRSFQQRQLLSGKPTENFDIPLLREAMAQAKALREERAELEAMLAEDEE
jgi:hypothetical protein